MSSDAAQSSTLPYPTRFSWAMRLFLGLFLFNMLFRSFSVLYPWQDWADELDLTTMPRRLPTRAELAALPWRADTPQSNSIRGELRRTLDSLGDFVKPWPEASARQRIHSWADGGKWALAWTSTRLGFLEGLVGVNQEWPMFSPSVSRYKLIPRARLVYADGSEQIVRGKCDPADLTCYSHWWEEKILDYELKVAPGGESKAEDNFGYCNVLQHRYPHNDQGAKLKTIYLFIVRIEHPPPGVDARAWLTVQSGPPPQQIYPDFYEFDVAQGRSRILQRSYDK